MQHTKEQKISIVVNFLGSNSIQHVQELFQERFPERNSPSKVTIWKNVRKYKTEGTSLNLDKGRSGRKSTERAPENAEIVEHFFKKEWIGQKDSLRSTSKVSISTNNSHHPNNSTHSQQQSKESRNQPSCLRTGWGSNNPRTNKCTCSNYLYVPALCWQHVRIEERRSND
ncbi:Protein of unknown function DUF4817 [Trinorchestia longiramus]|nr:Protein of unknown function DUF4817 [Trinorchestia longiramus]